MIPRVIEAKYVRNYVIHIRFSDGAEGDIDLTKELEGEIFEPLKNISFFKRFRVDPELHTIVWHNDADFAPEFLYEKLHLPA